MAKRFIGEENLRSVLHAAVTAEPSCAGIVKGIEIKREDGERANWDAALLRSHNDKIPGNCMRAFLSAKSYAFNEFDLETDD